MAEAPYVLVVDDDEAYNYLTDRILKRSGLSVELKIAMDGLEARECIRDHGAPAFAFLDLRMPVLDGFSLLEQLAEEEHLPDFPVVVVTSSTLDEDRARALEFPVVVDYVEKPLTNDGVRDLRDKFLSLNHCFGAETNP